MIAANLFDLQRFVTAQAHDYATALAEIRAGRKRSHWIWYIFPQLRGLGRSETAQFYGIGSLDEARAYLAHPQLGPRLMECIAALQALPGDLTATQIFGELDAMKLCSSLTLFIEAAENYDAPLLAAALERWFDGTKDAGTLGLLQDL